MESIYDTTLPHRDGYYTVGLIDYLDPTHEYYHHIDTREGAAYLVLEWIEDRYLPKQIAVLSPDGKRLQVSVCPIPFDGMPEDARASDFVTFS